MIHFEKVTSKHLDTIWKWLAEPFIQEFWDNTQAHKDDIINFVQGRKTPSSYANGEYVYWIAFLINHKDSQANEPFAMLMTIQETYKNQTESKKLSELSKTGHTYGLDYMIGNPNFFGKGYGARTLTEFLDYFRAIDPKADTFLIDPSSHNPRAKAVYLKAGFEHVVDFTMQGEVSGKGKLHHLLVKKFKPEVMLIKASMENYPIVANMARFYAYDLSRFCACLGENWNFPEHGMYESFDPKKYFEDKTSYAYLVRVYGELAGFVLIEQLPKDAGLYMGEFYITAKFQSTGVAQIVAHAIFDRHKCPWEVTVIPQNFPAISFWEKAINKFTNGNFKRSIKEVEYDKDQPNRIFFNFDCRGSHSSF